MMSYDNSLRHYNMVIILFFVSINLYHYLDTDCFTQFA